MEGENGLLQSVLLKEVVIEPNVRLECVPKFCYLGDTLKDRKRSVDLYSLLGVESVAEVVRRGRLTWFGHVERKSGDDRVSACRNVIVAGVRCAGRARKTWRECVKDDMDELGLHSEWVVFRDKWRGLISGKRLTLAERGRN